MTNPSSQERYKNNLLVLTDVLHELYIKGNKYNLVESNQNTLFFLIKTYIKSCSGEMLITKFIKKTNEHWDKIYEKDIEYFKTIGQNFLSICDDKGLDHFKKDNNSTILKTLSNNHIEEFKTILSASYKDSEGNSIELLDDDTKTDIWNIFHSFVKISICYLHENEVFTEINKKELAKKWKIKKLL